LKNTNSLSGNKTLSGKVNNILLGSIPAPYVGERDILVMSDEKS
jgi:hypothetical protein